MNKRLRQMGGNIQYVSGGVQYFDLPRWGVLYEMVLRIALTITSAAGAAPSVPLYQTLCRIVRNVSVIANGRDYIINAPGETLAALAYIDNKRVVYGSDAALPSAVSTAYNYVIYLPIRFSLPYAERPDDTGLNLGTPQIAGVPAQLKITWANSNCSELFGTPAGAAISGVDCQVMGDYETDPMPVFNNVTDKGKPRVWLTRTLDQKVITLTASNTKFPVIVDEGTGVFLRSLLLETLDDSVGADTILNNGEVALRIGGDVFGIANAGFIKDWMAKQFQVAPQSGVYYWDFTLFQSNSTLINTANIPADLIAYLEATKVAGTNEIVLTREGIRPLQAAA